MNLKTLSLNGLYLLLAFMVTNGIFILYDQQYYFNVIESLIFSDRHIQEPGFLIFRMHIFFFILITILMYITSNSISLLQSFEKSSKINKFAFFVILIPTILYNIILYSQETILNTLLNEDTYFELLTIVCAFATSVFLLMNIHKKEGYVVISYKLILAILFFLFGMEEMSWGQRIIGWETPGNLSNLNYQNEYNFHNIFNPFFNFIYPIFNLLVGAILVNAMKLKTILAHWFNNDKYADLIPRHESVIWGFVFLALSIHGMVFTYYSRELNEVVFSIFGLAYSIDQLSISKAADQLSISKAA